MDRLLETFLDMAVIGGSYWLGTKDGENRAMQKTKEELQREEIAELRRQLNELKGKPNS